MEQFRQLQNFLNKITEVPPTEWLFLVGLLKIKKLDKNAFYFKQGESFGEISFVLKGLLYNYYLNEQGDEIVKYFINEGGLVSEYSSLILKGPAKFSCKAIESCLLVSLQYEDLTKLYERHKCWERMGRLSAERLFVEKEMREYRFLTMDAKSHFESFLVDNPKLIDRVPQYLVASYLGISPVTLSRIKA